MGCDIHCYIEYKQPGSDYWNCFGGNLSPGRDYDLFGKLAGLRGGKAMIPLRGIPERVSWRVHNDNGLFVAEDGEPAGEGCVNLKKANEWLAKGIVKRIGGFRISHSDWHSHSWLTSEEFEMVLSKQENVSPEYCAIVAAMRAFEEQGMICRVVFWFDN